jgi:hypothetical protein
MSGTNGKWELHGAWMLQVLAQRDYWDTLSLEKGGSYVRASRAFNFIMTASLLFIFVHFCSLRLQHLHTAAILQPLSLEKVESRVSQLL